MNAFGRFASLLGVAFQIQDDVLNLIGNGHYGKEIAGDLWEGKHTLILVHAMRSARPCERKEALRILEKPRPPVDLETGEQPEGAGDLLQDLRLREKLTLDEYDRLSAAVNGRSVELHKRPEEVEFLRDLIVRYDGIGYASRVAERRAAGAARAFDRIERRLAPSAHADFLRGLVDFVIRRTR
jgi:geranylgeranyl diphosphate synthase type II